MIAICAFLNKPYLCIDFLTESGLIESHMWYDHVMALLWMKVHIVFLTTLRNLDPQLIHDIVILGVFLLTWTLQSSQIWTLYLYGYF